MRLDRNSHTPVAHRKPWRTPAAAVAGAALLALSACTATPIPTAGGVHGTHSPPSSEVPKTDLTELATDLKAPTDMTVSNTGTVLLTMGRQIVTVDAQGRRGEIPVRLPGLAATERPLLGLTLAPAKGLDWALFVCYQTDVDLRVARLEVAADTSTVTDQKQLLSDIPLNPGRLGGCELAIGPDGQLYIGTSDGQQPRAPQDPMMLGGKILRVDPATGAASEGNPFADRSDPATQRIYSLGHHDITALAWHPSTGTLFAVDQGPGREDEVNIIVPGGNYGWNPASASTASYVTDGVPMTDLAITNARPAVYNTGPSPNSAEGMFAATFISWTQWGVWSGTLAITNSGSPRIVILPITGEVVGQPSVLEAVNVITPSQAITQDAEGAIYLSTATGENDRLLRLRVID